MTAEKNNRIWLKAIGIALIPPVFASIAGAIISIMQINGNSATQIQAALFFASLVIGFIIVKKMNFSAKQIGFCSAESKSFNKLLFFIPLIIIEILPFFTGFKSALDIQTIGILLIFTLIVGMTEELYFRGIILNLFKANIGKAIFVSSLLFGILHIANALSGIYSPLYVAVQIIFAFVFAIVCAEIVVISKTIVPVIIFHFAHDFIASITNDSVEGKAVIIPIVQIAIMVIYGLIVRKYLTVNQNYSFLD